MGGDDVEWERSKTNRFLTESAVDFQTAGSVYQECVTWKA